VTLRHEDIVPKLDVRHLGTLGLGGGSQAFWDFLQAHVEERMFHVGERVVFDSQHKNVHQKLLRDTSFCRLNRGRIRISEAGSPERAPRQTLVTALCGASRDATSTIREDDLRDGAILTGDMILSGKMFHAVEVCYVSILHRGVIARALELYPEDRDELLPPLAAASGLANARGDSAIRSIQERSIFAGASQEFIDAVIEESKVRVFMPGDFIIRQGSEGFTMFILWIGSANVILESEELPADGQGARTRTLKHVGTLGHGAAFGEMAMLGVQKKRNATIIASAVSCAWEIDFQNVRTILEKHPRECDNFLNMIEGHLERVANVHLTDYHLFANFSHGFRTFLSVHAHRHLYFEGETIVKEGSAGDQLFVVNLGAARVEILGQHVQSVLRGGAHFGYGMVCRSSAKERYSATVTAESMCQVFIIRRVDFQKALTKYPDMRDTARSLDTKEARLAREQQEHAKMLVKTQVKRSQHLKGIMDACAGMFDYSTEDVTTTRQIYKLYFTAWRSEAARGLAVRKEAAEVLAANQEKIDRWLLRRKEQMEQTQPHRDMKTLLAQNLHTRGPLTVPKPDSSSRSVGAPSEFMSPSSSFAASTVASPYLSPMPQQRSYMAPQHVELPPLPLAGLNGSPWTSRPSTGAPLSDRPNTAPVPGFMAGSPLATSPTAKPSTARGHSRRRADKWNGVAPHYHQRCRRPIHWGTPSCVPDPVLKSPFDEASREENSLMEEVPELLEVEAVQH
jgi:CRP-like cAMP-binding protein